MGKDWLRTKTQKDWTCSKCGDVNFSKRDACRKCGAPRAKELEGDTPAPVANAAKKEEKITFRKKPEPEEELEGDTPTPVARSGLNAEKKKEKATSQEKPAPEKEAKADDETPKLTKYQKYRLECRKHRTEKHIQKRKDEKQKKRDAREVQRIIDEKQKKKDALEPEKRRKGQEDAPEKKQKQEKQERHVPEGEEKWSEEKLEAFRQRRKAAKAAQKEQKKKEKQEGQIEGQEEVPEKEEKWSEEKLEALRQRRKRAKAARKEREKAAIPAGKKEQAQKKEKKEKIKKEGAAGQERAAKRRDVDEAAGALDDGDMATTALEDIVFGRSVAPAPAQPIPERPRDKKDKKKRREAQNDEEMPDAEEEKAGGKAPKVAAWSDPDDKELRVQLDSSSRLNKLKKRDNETQVSGVEYEKRLRDQFVKLHGQVSWTEEKPEAEASDSDEDLEEQQRPAASSGRMLAEKQTGGMLKPGSIQVQRLKNVHGWGGEGKGPAAINSMQFHPTSELLLSAGFDKRLYLFSVDGDENNKLSSHFFKHFPINEATFTPTGDQVLMSGGQDPKLWCLDVSTGEPSSVRPLVGSQVKHRFSNLVCGPHPSDCPGLRSNSLFSVQGDEGSVLVCDVATKHSVRTLRMRTKGIQGMGSLFSTTRDTLITADRDCNIYEWDLGSGRCMHRFKDPWATKITALAMSRASEFSPTPVLAVGTDTGNVDFFDAGGPSFGKEPTSTVDNLTTWINWLKFHPSGQIMAASSRVKNDSLKLVHTRTSTVFANWPTMGTPLSKVSVVDFSRRDGLMAVGNEKGRILIYQLASFAPGVA